MIRLIVRFGSWLDARFPAKLTVTTEAYAALGRSLEQVRAEADLMRDELSLLKANHSATIDRVGHLEATSVHKGAVNDLIQHLGALKAKQTALEANLGWVPNAQKAEELGALLNGEPL